MKRAIRLWGSEQRELCELNAVVYEFLFHARVREDETVSLPIVASIDPGVRIPDEVQVTLLGRVCGVFYDAEYHRAARALEARGVKGLVRCVVTSDRGKVSARIFAQPAKEIIHALEVCETL